MLTDFPSPAQNNINKPKRLLCDMALKLRDKHQQLQNLVIDLEHKEKPIWKAVAKGLNRPRRVGFRINLYRLDTLTESKETIVVPGVVLGTGEITKPPTVAAWRFSGSAKQKIEKAGGKCLDIPHLVKEHPDGKGVRLMG